MDFAVQIINLVKSLKEKRESIISNQMGRSGTSIGANIREAQYAHGKADFIAKLQIALKEANETGYWLELLYIGGDLQHLHALADEIGAELPELFKFAVGICDKGAILGGIIRGDSVIVRHYMYLLMRRFASRCGLHTVATPY